MKKNRLTTFGKVFALLTTCLIVAQLFVQNPSSASNSSEDKKGFQPRSLTEKEKIVLEYKSLYRLVLAKPNNHLISFQQQIIHPGMISANGSDLDKEGVFQTFTLNLKNLCILSALLEELPDAGELDVRVIIEGRWEHTHRAQVMQNAQKIYSEITNGNPEFAHDFPIEVNSEQ